MPCNNFRGPFKGPHLPHHHWSIMNHMTYDIRMMLAKGGKGLGLQAHVGYGLARLDSGWARITGGSGWHFSLQVDQDRFGWLAC